MVQCGLRILVHALSPNLDKQQNSDLRSSVLAERRRSNMAPRAVLPQFARRSFPRITADLALQPNDVDELVSLAAQLLSDHRRLRRDGGDDDDAHAAPLHCLHKRAKIAVAGK